MRRSVKFSTACQMILAWLLLFPVAQAQDSPPPAAEPPLFRTVEDAPRPDLPDNTSVKLVTDENFAPYSFVSNAGSPAGMAVELAIAACKKHGKYVGICGQGPSDHPDLAQWLVSQGIDSLSLNPDSVMGVRALLGSLPRD